MRTRRRRRPALVAGLGGLAGLVLAGCWPVPAANPDRTNHNPHETTLTWEDVGDLVELWRYTPGSSLGTPSDPVTSAGGVHVTVGCGVVTLDPATGAERWSGGIPDAACGVGVPHQGEPYVLDTGEGQRVVASYGESAVRAPGFLVAEWRTRSFDPATGAASPATSGFVVAARDGATVSATRASVGPLTAGELIGVDGRTFTLHAASTAIADPVSSLTLGTDLVFHTGHAIATTTPGQPVFGQGVRAYPRVGGTGGCGPVTGPVASISVACPAWFTPTDGPATRPVLHAASGSLITRTAAGTLYVLDAATGAVRWTSTGHGAGGAPVLLFETIWLPTGTGQLQPFSVHGCGQPTCGPTSPYFLETGTGQPVTAAAAAGDALLFATSGGEVHASTTCTQDACPTLWSAPGTGSPVISDGRVYVTDGASLVAYGLPPG
jgi:outer membrane protein assembly factor BamB